jgi:hypothetical protein
MRATVGGNGQPAAGEAPAGRSPGGAVRGGRVRGRKAPLDRWLIATLLVFLASLATFGWIWTRPFPDFSRLPYQEPRRVRGD